MHCLSSKPLRWVTALVVRRALWALMGIVHAPALISAWHAAVITNSDPSRLDTCLWLTLSTVFFALKAWDVECLRFNTSRRSLVAITVAVGLLHAEAIGERMSAPALPPEVPIVATAFLASGLKAVQRAGEACVSSRPRRAAALPQTGDVALVAAFSPHRRILISRSRIPRAPPA
jgi:hypothetical protein